MFEVLGTRGIIHESVEEAGDEPRILRKCIGQCLK